ncbi:hypothetical protein [Comamonas thiooxydans]|uniref:hypothetical protein n=1 Tax=Comamonas thiooxydans TaxID=363952 RepID=UPI000ADAB27C|nr:hypothetical protein [Comamonas thiooxydans]
MSATYTPHEVIAWVDEHGVSTAGWQCSPTYAKGTGSMDGWSTFLMTHEGRPAELSKHIDLENGHQLHLKLSLAREHAREKGNFIHWESVLKVGDRRYVNFADYAPDIPTALQRATSHQHESRQIGALTWWLESNGSWKSWLGDINLRASLISGSGNDPAYWYFESSGTAPSLEEAALLAAMHQPFNHS